MINGLTLTIRPLIERNKRVVISNVYPTIPHDVILNSLKNIGINPVSQIHYIRAGLNKPGRSHILSFRRQVYIKEEEEKTLPDSLKIFHDNTNHYIFLSTDSTQCFVCKQSGHIANKCPNNTKVTHVMPIITDKTNEQKDNSTIFDNNSQNTPQIVVITAQPNKRPPPSTSSENSTPKSSYLNEKEKESENNVDANDLTEKDSIEFISPKKHKHQFKKRKTNTEASLNEDKLDQELQPINKILKDGDYPMEYAQLKTFLVKTYGQRNVKDIALQLTTNIDNIIQMLDLTYKHTESRTLKDRCSRIKKRLLRDKEQDMECSSDYSTTSDNNQELINLNP